MEYIREWLFEKSRIIAVVGLHVNTFKPHTGTKTSVLFLQKWAENNVAYFTAQRLKRRGLEKVLTPFEFWVLQEAVDLCRLREVVVGGKWQVDHVIPVSKGGHSRPDNIQVVPAIWNRRKSNVHTERFFGARK